MDIFNEQLVKRAKKPKEYIIKIVAVLLLITIPLLCALLAIPLKLGYLIYVAFFLFVGGIYAVWYVFGQQKVEYEYSVSMGVLTVSKIIALRKRKKMCDVEVKDFEILGKGAENIEGMRFAKEIIAAADPDNTKENYYAVYNSPAYGRTLLVFNPNEKILNAMKSNLKRELVIKLFYKRG